MLRWTTPFLVAIFAIGTAAAEGPGATKTADGPAAAKPCRRPGRRRQPGRGQPAPPLKPATSPAAAKRAAAPARHGSRRQPVAARPAPRPLQIPDHGCPRRAPLYVRRGRTLVVEEEDRAAVHRRWTSAPYAPRIFGTPLLPGSSTLPGYYGTSHSYSYDGALLRRPLYALLEPPALRLRRVRILLNAR